MKTVRTTQKIDDYILHRRENRRIIEDVEIALIIFLDLVLIKQQRSNYEVIQNLINVIMLNYLS